MPTARSGTSGVMDSAFGAEGARPTGPRQAEGLPHLPHLLPEACEALLRHVASCAPEEGCGVLLGRRGAVQEIVEAVPGRNAAAGDRTREYTLDPADLIAALAHARREGLELLGFYHSHPGGACFSAADRAAAWPGMLYLVVSLRPGGEAEFAWHGGAP